MKTSRIEDTIGGWFVGNFDKAAYKEEQFEVSYKVHPKGEDWGYHYHEFVTEVNLLVRGKMKIHGQVLTPGTIFILEPFEIADPEFLEDCEIVCVKTPGITNDKINLKRV